MNEQQTPAPKMSKEERKEMNKKVLWGPIKDAKLANFTIDEVVKAFYLLAAINVVIGLLLMFPYLIEGLVLASIAFALKKTRSRIAAGVLILLGGLSVAGTILNIANGASGGINIVLSILVLWFSIRAFQAANFLAQKK